MQLFRLTSLLFGILFGLALLLGSVSPVLSAPCSPRMALIAQGSPPLSETQNTQPQNTTAETAATSPKQLLDKQERPPQPDPESPTSIKRPEANRTPPDSSYDMKAIQQFNRDVYGAP